MLSSPLLEQKGKNNILKDGWVEFLSPELGFKKINCYISYDQWQNPESNHDLQSSQSSPCLNGLAESQGDSLPSLSFPSLYKWGGQWDQSRLCVTRKQYIHHHPDLLISVLCHSSDSTVISLGKIITVDRILSRKPQGNVVTCLFDFPRFKSLSELPLILYAMLMSRELWWNVIPPQNIFPASERDALV